jgi:hypothetical protein
MINKELIKILLDKPMHYDITIEKVFGEFNLCIKNPDNTNSGNLYLGGLSVEDEEQ